MNVLEKTGGCRKPTESRLLNLAFKYAFESLLLFTEADASAFWRPAVWAPPCGWACILPAPERMSHTLCRQAGSVPVPGGQGSDRGSGLKPPAPGLDLRGFQQPLVHVLRVPRGSGGVG